ncbi:uncharacterized protein YcfL [Nicoletella semolina]|uniref:Uncharacterized protein YcfL n=1 Tax=Nicoletella semolina TaxID=271160 RepID=A0A4R2N631_9PAST|nr:YcfL family protein [Nicoletella semolina]MDH2925255.1 hypothetical protein [Nicoletella semolina]TCP16340.1 uncharacterized protein YcfL [Nicoletella semolina]
MLKLRVFLCALCVCLVGCSGSPNSYLPTQTQPILNIETSIATSVATQTQEEQLVFTNLKPEITTLAYKIFWYDQYGVTQTIYTPTIYLQAADQLNEWRTLSLQPNERREISLTKPTAESTHYRVYVRAN